MDRQGCSQGCEIRRDYPQLTFYTRRVILYYSLELLAPENFT